MFRIVILFFLFFISVDLFAARKTVVPTSTSDILSSGTATNGSSTLDVVGSVMSGVAVDTSSGSLPVPVQTKISVPTSTVLSVIKSGLKSSPVSFVASVALTSMLDSVGVLIDGATGRVVKPIYSGPLYYDPNQNSGYYYWYIEGYSSSKFPDAMSACTSGSFRFGSPSALNDNGYGVWCGDPSINYWPYRVIRGGGSCPANSTYSSTQYACITNPSAPTPLVSDADFAIFDNYIQGADGVWQQQALADVCRNSPSLCTPLDASRALTGPSVLALPDSTTSTTTSEKPLTVTNPDGTTTTSPSSETSTTTKSGQLALTYGDNYVEYNEQTITTTNNSGNGSVVTTTENSTVPAVPDYLAGANDDIAGIPNIIKTQGSSLRGLPYVPWFDMSGSCKEHTFLLPVIGSLTTNYCPIHEAYVRPFLYFIFALWTWHSCFAIWSVHIQRVRAS